MKKYSVIFFIKQSLKGLFMNSIMSVTSVFILTACLILTGCFALLSLNANINLQQLDSLNKIVFLIDQNYESEEDVERIKNEIRSLPNVGFINFISKEDALEKLMEQDEYADIFGDQEFIDGIRRDNPLLHKIEIEYKNIDDVQTLDYQLKCIEGMYKVNNEVKVAEIIQSLKNVIGIVLVGFSLVLFVLAIFIILNTVRLSVHARKSEIEIMRYIGATNFFIVFPFLLEGIIIGVVSGIIAFIGQYYIYEAAKDAILKMSGGLEFINFSDVGTIVFLGFILTGALCGLFGSGISSRRYLKV